MAVLEVELDSGVDGRVVQREAHAVLAQQQPPAPPPVSLHVPIGACHVLDGSNDHPMLLLGEA
jgi:hypothetical protein